MGKRKSVVLLCIFFLFICSAPPAMCSSSLLCASFPFLTASSPSSQETDPFYLRLLTQGERSLLAKKYREAAKELEIAAFGLHKETNLKAKALAYMSISYYYLRDMENCEKYMRQALDLIGAEKTADLEKEIDESLRNDFQKLLVHFKLAPEEEKEIPSKAQ